MTDKDFEQLWQRAEAAPHAERLAAGLGDWRQRQRRNMGIAASVAVVLVAGIALSTLHSPLSVSDSIYCNRDGIATSHWTTLAADMLMEA